MDSRSSLIGIVILIAVGALLGRSFLDGNAASASGAKDEKKGAAQSDAKKPEENPEAKLGSIKRKLEIAVAKLKQAEVNAAAQEIDSRQAVDHANMELKIATGKLAQFVGIDAPNRIAQEELNLQRVKDRAQEAAEELKQIEIMYEEQDLEDRTAEFVINRGKRNAERSRQQIRIQEKEFEALKGHELPREQATLELDVAKKRAAVEKAERDAEAGALLKEIAKMSAEAELDDLKEQLEKLEEKIEDEESKEEAKE